MIVEPSGMRLRGCRGRKVHHGFGLLGIDSISNRMAFIAAAAEKERLTRLRSRLPLHTRHSAASVQRYFAEGGPT